MLAKRLGAEVKRSPKLEIGCYTVQLTHYGKNDPLFLGFPETFPVFQWHGDVFEIPSEGQLLAKGDLCPIQSFAWKNIRGCKLTQVDVLLKVMKKTVNQEQGPFTCEVDKGMMMKIPWAVGDPNQRFLLTPTLAVGRIG